MILFAIAIGAILGLIVLRGPAGFFIGGLLGYLLFELLSLKTRVAALEREREASVAPARTTETPTPSQEVSVAPTPTPDPVHPVSTPAPAPMPAPDSYPLQTPATADSERAPDIIDRLHHAVRDFFTSGNTVVRVGVVILFFGVAFLLKYAAERAAFPIELRLAATAAGAIALLLAGIRLRRKNEGYGLALEGGAIGILFLTIFAAFRLYSLVPASFAFGLLLVTCIASAALAILQNSLALAALGAAGGFLAPVLASTGEGSHVALFSYYAVLNVGIVAVAWFKAWRLLNLIGFGFTFVVGAMWGYRFYQPEFFYSTEPFLILFFVLYVAVAILFARRRPPALGDPVDGTLVFGVPIVGGLLQAALVKSFAYGMAWSALALGAFYLALAGFVLKRNFSPLLAEAFLALGVIFATLTIPLAVDGHWTAAAWAIEGAGILWVGLRQSRLLAQGFGLIIQLGAGFFFLLETKPAAEFAVVNSAYVGGLLVSGAGLLSAFLLGRYAADKAIGGTLAMVMLSWGLIWWFGANYHEIDRHLRNEYAIAVWLAVIGVTTWLQDRLGARLQWQSLRVAALLNVGLLAIAFVWVATTVNHPFANFGYVAWPLALTAYYALLARTEAFEHLRGARHVGTLWLMLAIIGWEVSWAVDRWLPHGDWSTAALGLVLAGAFLILSALRASAWPVRGNEWAYRVTGALPVAVLTVAWIVYAALSEAGNPAPLPYVPLLNPLDVAAMFVLLALLGWVLKARAVTAWPVEPAFVALGALAFAWLNAVLFRTLHHMAAIPYSLHTMLDSVLVQATLSLFWTVLAFVLMLVATRTKLRYLWAIGAGLLGIVVVKLFAVDLSNTGTIERIVSFVGVGVLLLVIGYLAPVPPRAAAEARS